MQKIRILNCIRRISTFPHHTDYYKLSTHDLDNVLGLKRVESSRLEAAVRRIAQKLFLYEDVQRALIEQEIKQDEIQYLHDFVDARDISPRPLPTSQLRLAKELRTALQTQNHSVVNEVAQILWKHPIRRRSTYQMVAREMLKLNHGKAAQHIMESLLMATKKNQPDQKLLGNAAYSLCLELAMENKDHTWFMELSKVRTGINGALTQKFELTHEDPKVELLLAEGFMKFGHPHLLDEVLKRNKDRKFYVKLLAVSMELAARFNDKNRAQWTFNEFSRNFDPSRTAAVRFLLLARKHESTKYAAIPFVEKLTPNKRRLYRSKELVWQYVHPYAN